MDSQTANTILTSIIVLYVLAMGSIQVYYFIKRKVSKEEDKKQSLKQIAIILLSNEKGEAVLNFIKNQIASILERIKKGDKVFLDMDEYISYIKNQLSGVLYTYIIDNYPQFKDIITKENISIVVDEFLNLLGYTDIVPEGINIETEILESEEDDYIEEDFLDDIDENIIPDNPSVEYDTQDEDDLEEDMIEEKSDEENVGDAYKRPAKYFDTLR